MAQRAGASAAASAAAAPRDSRKAKRSTLVFDTCLELADSLGILRIVQDPMYKFAAAVNLTHVQRTTKVDSRTAKLRLIPETKLRSGFSFDTHVPRGIISGVKGSLKNSLYGSTIGALQVIISPVIGLVTEGPRGLARNTMLVCCWTPILLTLVYASAIHQVVMGFYVFFFSWFEIAFRQKEWDPVDGGFKPYSLDVPFSLEGAPDPAKLISAARKRMAKSRDKAAGITSSSNTDGSNSSGDEEILKNFSYYKKLGVKKDATTREIKEAYNVLALELHPDRNPSPEASDKFTEVTKAYKVLSRPAKRELYDVRGDSGVTGSGAEAEFEDMQKRDALNAIYGGEAMVDLLGEIRTGVLSRYLIDEISILGFELTLLNELLFEPCGKNFLHLLDGFDVDFSEHELATWRRRLRIRVEKLCLEGLGSAVVKLAAEEIEYVIQFCDPQITGPIGRTAMWLQHEVVRDRILYLDSRFQFLAARSKFMQLENIANDRGHAVKVMIDFLQGDVFFNVRRVTKRVLLDQSCSPQERKRRLAAMKIVQEIFANVGKPVTTIDDELLLRLQSAVEKAQSKRK